VADRAGERWCPHCEHFADWHMGLPFNGGPNGQWRYRCRCGCTVDVLPDDTLRALDPDTYEPLQPTVDNPPSASGSTPAAGDDTP